MRKLGKMILVLIMLLSTVLYGFMGIGTKVDAANFFVNEATLVEKNATSGIITYNGDDIVTTYVYYTKDGEEYPAYCISPGADGVGEYGSYNVSVDSYLSDAKLWRVITNGYPYKSPEELGCISEKEAFIATKHAVYCAILERDSSAYGAINEQGERVVNAIANILSNANASTSGKVSNNIEIIDVSSQWEYDKDNSKYLTRTFEVLASTTYDQYSVEVDGNYPEGTDILDSDNNSKTSFSSGEISFSIKEGKIPLMYKLYSVVNLLKMRNIPSF